MISLLLATVLAGQNGLVPLVLSSWEFKVVQATNAERVRHNLWPLAVDPMLQESARMHAESMAMSGYRHSGYPGENIASGQNTADWVMRDWMESPAHRANILNPSYQWIGVGSAVHPKGYRLWVQQFGM